jgi:1-acylglycerone phosphate reductase
VGDGRITARPDRGPRGRLVFPLAYVFSVCLELEPFGIKVIELKTGAVATNMIKNHKEAMEVSLPKDSIYGLAKEAVESWMRYDSVAGTGTPADQWAKKVVQDLMRKTPPSIIWRGAQAMIARVSTFFPHGMMDGQMKKMAGLDVVESRVRVGTRAS